MHLIHTKRAWSRAASLSLATASAALAALFWVWGARSIGASEFMPHGYCYLWNPLVLWLNVISDTLITLSYYCIPVVLIYFARTSRELPFNRIFWMFGAFILACGTTHLMEVWNIWHASYLAAGMLKALTALISVITAAMLIPLVPKLISLPGRVHLQEVNRRLEAEITRRMHYDVAIEDPFRRKVNSGFVVAVLVTLSAGASAWWGARRAEQDEYQVSHTHEVMETLQRTTRHTIEATTGARAFSLTGEEPLLMHYQTARVAISKDLDTLRQLTAGREDQLRRLDLLQPRINTALEFCDRIISSRRQQRDYDGSSDAIEVEKQNESVRESTRDMYQEEKRALEQSIQRAQSGQRLTRIIAFTGALLGLSLWGLAKVVVNREIDISSRARAQVNSMNVQLEERVAERTAALETANRDLKKEIQARTEAQQERERTQDALREKTRVLQLVMDSMGEGLIAADRSGKFLLWNQSSTRLLHRGPSEVPPDQWSDYFGVFHPDGTLIPAEQLPLARALAGEDISSELLIRPASGEGDTWLEVVARPLRGEDGALQGGVAVLRDITLRKKAEQEKEQYTEELKRSNAELEQFAYVASHDLQEPLRMVASYTEILGERYRGKLDASADKYIGYAVDGAQRMQRLIRDLLAYARVSSQAKPPQPTDASAVLTAVLHGLHPAIESNKAEIVFDQLPTVMADEVQLGQVFQNLINNAIKFHSDRTPQVAIRAQASGRWWHFSVEDNGIGMEMESAGRIFQMFQRLHSRDEYEGTGIGLAIAKRIVERHGGRIWVDSVPGQGSTFHFTLPKVK